MEVANLATETSDIPDTIADGTQYFQRLSTAPKSQAEAEHVVKHIVAIIEKEAGCSDGDFPSINQGVLNLAFRTYFNLLQRYQIEDSNFTRICEGTFSENYSRECQMLHAILLTDQWKHIKAEELKEKLLQTLAASIRQNDGALLAVLKVLNLLCKKFPTLDVAVSLGCVYNCLQSNNQVGVREETLHLFSHCCKCRERAFGYFKVISEFWPWTNRNKYFLLSCIFQQHDYREFLAATGHSRERFFAGLRLCLHYKNLLACSQYLVKALSDSDEMLELAAEIMTRGSLREVQNLHAHWFGRIAKKDRLFELLQARPEIATFLEDTHNSLDETENYRLILIFSLFSRQIFTISKLHFFKFSTELITNCFQYDNNSQLLIYKFIVDNLHMFSIEDCLEFILAFVQHHKTIENAQFRNNVLGKVATVINYISKTFNKMKASADFTTLGSSITTFFRQIQAFIEADIGSDHYQPKIFSLKLLEILVKSLYTQQLEKNTKNCSIAHNQQLGAYLVEQTIFQVPQMSAKLFALLDDPLGFDDALELIVKLLQLLRSDSCDLASESLEKCKDFCQRCDIDECALSGQYAKVALQSSTGDGGRQTAMIAQIHEFVLLALSESTLQAFRSDPLKQCKTSYNLFGYLNVLVECVEWQDSTSLPASYLDLMDLTENILNMVLGLLSAKGNSDPACTAASFQDIEESLQLLVAQSAHSADSNHDEMRRYLLMSFWFTLKACCELATAIACHVVAKCGDVSQYMSVLERCLQVNVAVLTRCRHKGAIEAAGVTIGKLTRCMTTHIAPNSAAYNLLHHCLQVLFDEAKQISTTRRGAGFSIMFLHIIKNEEQRTRPLLRKAMEGILRRLQESSGESLKASSDCVDSMESLTLHYLCVLVKDTEIRDAMAKYYNAIILAAMRQIDNPDWAVCNGALQLFGALIPKIVGQKQATEFEKPLTFESTDITFSEMANKLPVACEHILQYCHANCTASTSTRSIILFLEFFAKVDHLRKDESFEEDASQFLSDFRQLMWRLLRHPSEKVRQLAATCFVRAHEFRTDLPQALLGISRIVFQVGDENFRQGLILVITAGVQKLQLESTHVVDDATLDKFLASLRSSVAEQFTAANCKLYTLSKVLDLMTTLGFEGEEVSQLCAGISSHSAHGSNSIGYDVWHNKLEAFTATTITID